MFFDPAASFLFNATRIVRTSTNRMGMDRNQFSFIPFIFGINIFMAGGCDISDGECWVFFPCGSFHWEPNGYFRRVRVSSIGRD